MLLGLQISFQKPNRVAIVNIHRAHKHVSINSSYMVVISSESQRKSLRQNFWQLVADSRFMPLGLYITETQRPGALCLSETLTL